MPAQFSLRALAALARRLSEGRGAARDPRTPRAFPHAALAAVVVVAAVLALSGFTSAGRAAEARAAAPAALAVAAHPEALCFGRLDMRERVEAFATARWEICYRRGLARARLEIRGDGGSDLDCVVHDPAGRVVARRRRRGRLPPRVAGARRRQPPRRGPQPRGGRERLRAGHAVIADRPAP